MGDIIVPYNPTRICEKCGRASVYITTNYCRGGVLRSECTFKAQGEHMHRYCKRCHYEWPEACVPISNP